MLRSGHEEEREAVDAVQATGRGGGVALELRDSWNVVAVTTTLLAVAIVLGPITNSVAVALASLLWFGAIGYLVVDRVRAWMHGWSWQTALFCIGVGLAVLRMASLGLLQVFGGRSALFWSVDNRYAATLARGIARFGGAGDSLDYAGEPMQYHSGPAWIAGSLKWLLGIPVDFTLFLLVPVACMLVIVFASFRLLRLFGAPPVAAMFGVVVAVNLPRDPFRMLDMARSYGVRETLLSPDSWLFNSTLISNGVLALAVALTAAWALLVDRGRWSLLVGGTATAAVLGLKPQYFPALVVLVALLFVAQAWMETRAIPWKKLGWTSLWVGVLAWCFNAVNPKLMDLSGVDIDLGGVTRIFDFAPFAGRIPVLTLLTMLILVSIPVLRARQDLRLRTAAVVLVVAGLVALMGLASTEFLISSDLVRRANAFGFPLRRDYHDVDFSQALVLVGFLGALIAMAQLTTVAWTSRVRVVRYVPSALVVALLVATLPHTVSALRFPTGRAAYEWTDEVALRRLLRDGRVEVTDGDWLSSDLADSAEDFARPVRAVNLTSLSSARFYLANLGFVNWARSDAGERLRNVQRFFSTEWSDWHERFAREQDITYVLVRDRCPPAWTAADFPGRIIGRQGDWTLLRVGPSGSDEETGVEPPWSVGPARLAGSAPCRAFR